LDVLVNNAGIAAPANVEEETLEGWRKTQSVNMEGVFLGCRAAIAVMKEKGGSIINISSIEGIVGDPNTPAYNASKGGVRIFTKSVALHCAGHGYAIRVNSLHPGYILTPMVEKGLEMMPKDVSEAMLARVLGEIPLGTMGEPRDIAEGCLFLASDESKYMTGSDLVIAGGYTCHCTAHTAEGGEHAKIHYTGMGQRNISPCRLHDRGFRWRSEAIEDGLGHQLPQNLHAVHYCRHDGLPRLFQYRSLGLSQSARHLRLLLAS
jgi:hypothetical protein